MYILTVLRDARKCRKAIQRYKRTQKKKAIRKPRENELGKKINEQDVDTKID